LASGKESVSAHVRMSTSPYPLPLTWDYYFWGRWIWEGMANVFPRPPWPLQSSYHPKRGPSRRRGLLSKMLLMDERSKDFAISWQIASVENACCQLCTHVQGVLDLGVPGRHILADVISPWLKLVQLLLGSAEQGQERSFACGLDLVSKGAG
jgi:hypothetical protein